MGSRRVRARSAKSAMRKVRSKNVVATKTNYIKGTKKGKTGTYRVYYRKRKK